MEHIHQIGEEVWRAYSMDSIYAVEQEHSAGQKLVGRITGGLLSIRKTIAMGDQARHEEVGHPLCGVEVFPTRFPLVMSECGGSVRLMCLLPSPQRRFAKGLSSEGPFEYFANCRRCSPVV